MVGRDDDSDTEVKFRKSSRRGKDKEVRSSEKVDDRSSRRRHSHKEETDAKSVEENGKHHSRGDADDRSSRRKGREDPERESRDKSKHHSSRVQENGETEKRKKPRREEPLQKEEEPEVLEEKEDEFAAGEDQMEEVLEEKEDDIAESEGEHEPDEGEGEPGLGEDTNLEDQMEEDDRQASDEEQDEGADADENEAADADEDEAADAEGNEVADAEGNEGADAEEIEEKDVKGDAASEEKSEKKSKTEEKEGRDKTKDKPRDKDREKDRAKDHRDAGHKDKGSHRDRSKDRDRKRDADRDRKREPERERERDRPRDRDRGGGGRDRDRSGGRPRDRGPPPRSGGPRRGDSRERPRDRPRDRSRDRGDRRDSHRDVRGSSRRERSRSRGKDRERSRSRGKSRDRSRGKSRDRKADKEKDSRKDKDKDRKDKDKDKDKDRKDKDKEKDRRKGSKRSRSRSHSGSKERRSHRKTKSKSKSPEKEKKSADAATASAVPVPAAAPAITLELVMRQNPGISIPEAFQKFTAMKAAAAAPPILPLFPVPPGYTPAMAAAHAAALAIMPQFIPSLSATVAGMSLTGISAAATKAARELHVSNIPSVLPALTVLDAMNNAYKSTIGDACGFPPGNSIIMLRYGGEGHYAFCEFRTVEEATWGLKIGRLALGPTMITFKRPKGHTEQQIAAAAIIGGVDMAAIFAAPLPAGVTIPVQTEIDYDGQITASPTKESSPVDLNAAAAAAAAAAEMVNAKMGIITSSTVPIAGTVSAFKASQANSDSTVVMIMNLPKVLEAAQVAELLEPFGEHSRFNLLLDSEGNSKGTAVCEFLELEAASTAMRGLDNLALGDCKLMAQRVPKGVAEALLKKTEVIKKLPDPTANASCVVRLCGMVDNLEDLADDAEYVDIRDDIKDECKRYGVIDDVQIPRPDKQADEPVPGLGDIYVKFIAATGAAACVVGMNGRTFGELKVTASLYPVSLYNDGRFGIDDIEGIDEEAENTSLSIIEAVSASAGDSYDPFAVAAGEFSEDLGDVPDFDAMDMGTFEPADTGKTEVTLSPSSSLAINEEDVD